MRILLVSPMLPYRNCPHAGGKLVHFLMGELAKSHSVFLLARVFPGEDRHVPLLRETLEGVEVIPAPGPVREGNPLSVIETLRSYAWLAQMAGEILREGGFDLCQVEFTESGIFWPGSLPVPAAITCHDIIAKPAFRRYEASKGFNRITAWAAWRIKRELERRSLSKFRLVFTLSEEDREWGTRLYDDIPIRTLKYPGGIGFTGMPRRERENRILFVGALHRPPNLEAVRYFHREVWPRVREEVPEAEFIVVGGGVPEGLRRELSGDPRIVVTGYVENIEEHYKSAAVFAAPILTGGGIIVKILDAMAAEVAVVTTPYGNEGIRARTGEEILVAERPAAFADGVIGLLRNREARNEIAQKGRRFVERHFSPGDFVGTVEKAYRELVSSGNSRETLL